MKQKEERERQKAQKEIEREREKNERERKKAEKERQKIEKLEEKERIKQQKESLKKDTRKIEQSTIGNKGELMESHLFVTAIGRPKEMGSDQVHEKDQMTGKICKNKWVGGTAIVCSIRG